MLRTSPIKPILISRKYPTHSNTEIWTKLVFKLLIVHLKSPMEHVAQFYRRLRLVWSARQNVHLKSEENYGFAHNLASTCLALFWHHISTSIILCLVKNYINRWDARVWFLFNPIWKWCIHLTRSLYFVFQLLGGTDVATPRAHE